MERKKKSLYFSFLITLILVVIGAFICDIVYRFDNKFNFLHKDFLEKFVFTNFVFFTLLVVRDSLIFVNYVGNYQPYYVLNNNMLFCLNSDRC